MPGRPRLSQRLSSRAVALARDVGGVAAIELAIVAPLLAMLLFAIIGFGQLFWLSHAVQQIANDGARSTVAGLTAAERLALAHAAADHAAAQGGGVARARLRVEVAEDTPFVTVTARYDTADLAILRTGLVPFSRDPIVRRATVRMGGGA